MKRYSQYFTAMEERPDGQYVEYDEAMRPVQIIRDMIAALGPGLSAVPAVRAAYDFLETLDEPAPITAPAGMVDAIANDCAVELLREAAPFIGYVGPNGGIKERIERYLAQLDIPPAVKEIDLTGVPLGEPVREYVVFYISGASPGESFAAMERTYDLADWGGVGNSVAKAKRYTETEARARVSELKKYHSNNSQLLFRYEKV